MSNSTTLPGITLGDLEAATRSADFAFETTVEQVAAYPAIDRAREAFSRAGWSWPTPAEVRAYRARQAIQWTAEGLARLTAAVVGVMPTMAEFSRAVERAATVLRDADRRDR